MKQLPKITVITPVYNAAATFEKAIKSLISQDYPNLEYVVMDGGSTDGTLNIIKKYEKYITYWQSGPDGGSQTALNEGIKKSTGKIISILCADDWYAEGIFNKVAKALIENPDLDVVSSYAWLVKEKGGKIIAGKKFDGKTVPISPIATPMPNARWFKKDIFSKYGYFIDNIDGTKIIAGDLEFILRLSLQPIKQKTIPEVGYYYLENPGSMTFAPDFKMTRRLYKERVLIAEKFMREKKAIKNKTFLKRLKRWHRKGTVKEALWGLKEGNKKSFRENLKKGIKVNGLQWIISFMRIYITSFFKKIEK